MCTVPLIKAVCRESYNSPIAVYDKLKRLGMDLVTVTDHDAIDAVEPLRSKPDFFLSEEVTCRMPSGTELHMGVYDITERQHVEIQRRRADLEALVQYLREQRLVFSANHIFSSLTGRRTLSDFEYFEQAIPLLETRNGHMQERTNRQAGELAQQMGKGVMGGSDAHTMPSVGSAYTEVSGARSKSEFLEGLRQGNAVAHGTCGSYWKLTRDVLLIAAEMVRENPAAAALAPLVLAVPFVTLGNSILEAVFARRWMRKLRRAEAGKQWLPKLAREAAI